MKKLNSITIFLFAILFFSCNSSSQKENQNKRKANKEVNKSKKNKKKIIVFFGDSITEGYGLDKSSAYPAVLQEKIDSLNLNYEVVNAGLSGETTSAGVERVDWVLKQPIDIFVLALGGNDGLRGIKPQKSKESLLQIIEKVKKNNKQVDILLAGMEAPPNMGEEYTTEFRNIFKAIAEEQKLTFLPFLLENVGGEKELNQADGIHPNEKGQKTVANNIWKYLKTML